MLAEVLSAFALLAVCVVIHAGGLAALLRRQSLRSNALPISAFGTACSLVRVATWLLLLHLIQIAIWAVFYRWNGSLPDWQTAFYFSGVTYATVGYGDVLLPEEWQLLGPMEGLTGILMCGLSTGYFFVVVGRLLGFIMQSESAVAGSGPQHHESTQKENDP